MDWNGRVAVVTGAGSGIGAGIAKAFAREGMVAVVTCRSAEAGQRTVDEIRRAGGSAIFIQTDVASEASVKAMMAEVSSRYGRLDVLINNAGISFKTVFHEIETEEWDRVINTNLKGVFLCSRYAVEPMRKSGGGSIIHISSVDALRSLPKIAPYAASKGGINSLTQAMAIDLAPFNIRVNAILPGFVHTVMWEKWLASLSESERQQAMKEVLSALSIKRIGTPEDIAEAALFLASDKASYITGTTLVVDGGLTARAYVVSTD